MQESSYSKGINQRMIKGIQSLNSIERYVTDWNFHHYLTDAAAIVSSI